MSRNLALATAVLHDGRQKQAIAKTAGISAHTLSAILTGRVSRPMPLTRAAIAQALGKPEQELFPGRDGGRS